MKADEINKVIDKLAEKIGVAVEKVEPIAQEVIEQVQSRALLQGFSCIALIVFFMVIIFLVNYMKDNDEKYEEARLGLTSVATVIILIISMVAIGKFSTYIAPLAYILGV